MRAHIFLWIIVSFFPIFSLADNKSSQNGGGVSKYVDTTYMGACGGASGLTNSACQKSPTPAPAPTKQAVPAPEEEYPESPLETKTTPACQEANVQRNKCFESSRAAVASCDESNDSGLQTTLRNVQDVTGQADQILTSTGLNGGCGVVLKTANALSSAYLNFNQTCGQQINNCLSSCEAFASAVQACDASNAKIIGDMSMSSIDQSEPLRACQDQQGKQSQRNQFQNSVPALANQAAACKAALSAKGDGGPCASNPGSPLCQQSLKEAANTGNCSDPSQASNVTCACRGGLNTSACQAAMNGSQKLGAGAGSGMTASSNSRLGGATGKGTNAAPNFDDPAGELVGGSFKSQPADEIGGHMGGSAGLGGGGGAGGGNGGSGGGSDGSAGGINTNINGGFRGGGGGGGGGSWNGGGSGRAGGGAGRYAGAGGAINGMPNLNNFRPQMGYHAPVRRDLAGVVGPDGLLGPHADPWQTIKNRYNYEWRQGTLKP